MILTLWRAMILYSVSLLAYLQVTVGRQLVMVNVTNSSVEWSGWSEENSVAGVYWTVYDNSSFNGDIVLLNTSTTCPSCSSGSGSGVVEPQYSLLSPQYMILTNNCNSTISYTRRAEVTVEVIVRSNESNASIANLDGTVEQRHTKSLILNESVIQLIFSVTSNLNDELLSINDVNFYNCFEPISPTSSVESSLLMMMESTSINLLPTASINVDISTSVLASPDGLTASRMSSASSSQFNAPASSSMMIMLSTPSILATSEQVSIFPTVSNMPNVTSMSMLPILSSAIMSSLINTVDIMSVTSLVLQSTTSLMNASAIGISSISTLNATMLSSDTIFPTVTSTPITTTSATVTSLSVASSSSLSLINTSMQSSFASANTSLLMTEMPLSSSSSSSSSSLSVIITTTDILLSTTTIMPSSSNASQSDDTTFFSTNVIIGMAAGGGTLLLIVFCLLICCVCYRVRISRRNHHKFFITNAGYNNNHKGHSSVYAQERYRHKSRSAESVSGGPYHYELPFVHIETAPEAYTHSTNGDDDTIDSESEDIRHDLKGTPTSSRRGSLSTIEQPAMTSFYPAKKDEQQWSDYNSDNNEDETSSDIVYSNRNLLNEMCGGELPPILSLGDYEDDENLVIVNPYNPTLYSESNHVPNKDASPRRTATARSNINLEALTTLESSGEYTPKQTIPNYRRKHMSRSSAGKNHKALRKAKSEINLEDATKIVGAARYPRHQSKSRIDLKEATKLGHSRSDAARVSHQHRKPYHSSSPRILDSSSRLERLTSLNT